MLARALRIVMSGFVVTRVGVGGMTATGVSVEVFVASGTGDGGGASKSKED